MKKAFTLVELITLLVLIAVLSLIIIPLVAGEIKEANEQAYQTQINNIELAASAWLTDSGISINNSEEVSIYLMQLKQDGYLEHLFVNPDTDKPFPNDTIVKITANPTIEYEVIIGTNSGDYSNQFPVIRGLYVDVISTSSVASYDYMNLSAVSSTGDAINYSYTGTISEDVGTYNIVYSATDNGLNSFFNKTVLVRDLNGPEISFGSSLTVSASNVSSLDLKSDVTTFDDSGEVSLEVVNTLTAIPGVYTIKYIATDIYGNITTSYRDVTVTE